VKLSRLQKILIVEVIMGLAMISYANAERIVWRAVTYHYGTEISNYKSVGILWVSNWHIVWMFPVSGRIYMGYVDGWVEIDVFTGEVVGGGFLD
jgi:hypothetical protein